jgi:hypothetical protein
MEKYKLIIAASVHHETYFISNIKIIIFFVIFVRVRLQMVTILAYGGSPSPLPPPSKKEEMGYLDHFMVIQQNFTFQ